MTNSDVQKIFVEELYDKPDADTLFPEAYAGCVAGAVYDMSASDPHVVYDYGKMCAVFSKQTGLKPDVVMKDAMPGIVDKFNEQLRVPALAVCFISGMESGKVSYHDNEGLIRYLKGHDPAFGPSADKLVLAADVLAPAFVGVTIYGESVYSLAQACDCYLQSVHRMSVQFDDAEAEQQEIFLKDAIDACDGKAYIVDLFV